MAEGISLNLSCPSCGGAISTGEGIKSTNCPYCETLLWLEGDQGVFTVMFKNNLDDMRARQEMTKWFDKGLKARDLPTLAEIYEIFPIYIPFWRLRARTAGWVCGYKIERYRDSQGNWREKKVPLEKMVLRDFEWSEIACDPGDIGVNKLPGVAGDATGHEDGTIPTFEATTSPDDARNDGVESIEQMAIKSANVPNITFQKIHVLPRYLALTFYPVWIARYTYKGRTYFATLDGVNGRSLSGRAPGDPLYQSILGVGGSCAGGILTGLGVSGLFLDAPIELVGAGVVAGIIVFVLSFLFFRHGSEVTEGDIKAKYKVSAKDIKNVVKSTTSW